MGERASRGLVEGRPPAAEPRLTAVRLPAFVGRERELEVLLQAVITPPSAVIVEGEAGIGKTRLVREMLASAELIGRRALVGHCHRLREPFPLGPVVEALGSVARDPPNGAALSAVVGTLRPLIPELAAHLPARPEPLEDAGMERHRVFRGVLELLGVLGPTVLVLEDLHWADAGTVELLEFLAAHPPDGLCLVLTYRREELAQPSSLLGLAARASGATLTRTITPSPLAFGEAYRLIEGMLGGEELCGELVSVVYERTAGNPLAIEQVIGLLCDRGDLALRGGRWRMQDTARLGVPPALRDSVLQRIGLLGPDGRLLLQSAAALEREAEGELIRKVAGVAPARGRKGLCEGLSTGILEEVGNGCYGFRHALAAQAVYEDIPGPQRERLHLRAGRALEAISEPRPLAQIAYHLRKAKARGWTRYTELAAAAARSLGDDRTAARLLEDALAASELPRRARIRMAIALGDAALYSVSPDTAIRALRRVLEKESMALGTRGALRFSIARLLASVGDVSGRAAETARAVDELRRRPQLAARAMVNLASPRFMEGDLEDHLAWLERAVVTAGRQSDPVTTTAVLTQRAAILLYIGEPEAWSALSDIPTTSSSTQQSLQLLRGYHCLSLAALHLGHYRRAGSFLTTADRIHAELGHSWWGLWLATTRATCDWLTGAWHGLDVRSGELIEATGGSGGGLIRASLLLVGGELRESEFTVKLALEHAQATQAFAETVSTAGMLARIHLARGDAQLANEAASLGLDALRHKRIWVHATNAVMPAVEALIALGRNREARRLVTDFATGIGGKDAPAARAALAWCRGLLAEADGNHQAAAGAFGRAEAIFGKLPNPYQASQSREKRGLCLLTRCSEQGADLLLGALEGFECLGASWDAARVRRELRAFGVVLPYPWRGGPRGYGQRLSPREVEVAGLAAMGRTNREIAESLFLSVRTVEGHVAAAMRKLGVASRQALTPGSVNRGSH